jgi:hypothetical protein
MEMNTPEQTVRGNPFRRVWRWITGQVVQDVAQDEALCEFDCRKLQCAKEEWEACERRVQKGAGELMPRRKKPPSLLGA